MNNRYIVVMGWMMSALELSGNDLLCYALIYGYSQDSQGAYFGSLQHTADALNISRRAASDVINRLVERGAITRTHVEMNGILRCMYKAVVPAEAAPSPPPEPQKSARRPAQRFEPPTREEVADYCAQIGATIDADRFCDYYEANGWVQGRGKPLKSWKAAVRNWQRTEHTYNNGQKGNRTSDKEERIARRRATLLAEIESLDAGYCARGAAGDEAKGILAEAQSCRGGGNS